MTAYLSPVSHTITMQIRGQHSLSSKYSGAITVTHSQSENSPESLLFSHHEVDIIDTEDIKILTEIYNSLIDL